METKDAPLAEQRAVPARARRRPLVLALQVLAISLVAGLLALLVWRITARDEATRFVSAIAAGERPAAPDFSLPLIWRELRYWPRSLRPAVVDGELSLRELRGYPVVLNFWASWCAPCRDEAPAFAASARAHAGRVVFLGVDVQDLTSDARGFLRRYGVPYVSVRDGDDDVSESYGLTGVPETYYVDGAGRAVAHSPGPVERDTLEAGVRAALRSS